MSQYLFTYWSPSCISKLNCVLLSLISLGIHEWVGWNLNTKDVGVTPWDWSLFFGVACSTIWRDRNSMVFNRSTRMGTSLFTDIRQQVRFIAQELHRPTPTYLPAPRREVLISWKPSPCNTHKVNVDGSHRSGHGNSACGGLIQDDSGRWVKGFYCNVGRSNPI